MANAGRKSPLSFLREVRQEGRKVTWTSRKETIVTTIMVFIMVVIAAIFFLAVDQVLGRTIDFILARV